MLSDLNHKQPKFSFIRECIKNHGIAVQIEYYAAMKMNSDDKNMYEFQMHYVK